MNTFINSFEFNKKSYNYYDLKKIIENHPKLKYLPYVLKILLEQNLRNVSENDFINVINTFINRSNLSQIKIYANRIIMNEQNSVPTLVDFNCINEYFYKKDKNTALINPKVMIDVVVDNIDNNKQKNKQRYTFLKYVVNKYKNISIIPPNNYDLSLINLEYLSTMVAINNLDNVSILSPEVLLGTDSHSTVCNSLGILGLNIGRIDIHTAILGSFILIDFPQIIGLEIKGSLSQGTSFQDVLFELKQVLKNSKINGKIVEFFGKGLKNISIEDRTILSDLVIQCKGKCGYFPIDDNSIHFIEKTRGINAKLLKTYFEKQGLFLSNDNIKYDEYLQLDLSLIKSRSIILKTLDQEIYTSEIINKIKTFKKGNFVKDNDIVLCIIDTGLNSTNPSLLIQAALVAKKACEIGLSINENINKYLIFDSLIQKYFLEKLDLIKYLIKLGFKLIDKKDIDNITLFERLTIDIEKFNLNVSSLYSSRRVKNNKVNTIIKSNWMLSPALVIAYTLRGNINFDITKENIIQDIYLSDIWSSANEVNEYLEKLDYSIYKYLYKDVFQGDEYWKSLKYENSSEYKYDDNSSYISKIDSFDIKKRESIDIKNARILALLDDNISTEDIAPLGNITSYSPCALFLKSFGLRPDEFDTYENRYANSYVIIRSILSNIKLQNKIVTPKEGGYTKDFESGEVLSIYDFSVRMKKEKIPLVIFTGNRFGRGKINDWSVKGLKILGVKAVISKSFSSKYKTDLLKVGILPLEFIDDEIDSLKLKGSEIINIKSNEIKINDKIDIEIINDDKHIYVNVQSKLDSFEELQYYKNGGILEYLLKDILK